MADDLLMPLYYLQSSLKSPIGLICAYASAGYTFFKEESVKIPICIPSRPRIPPKGRQPTSSPQRSQFYFGESELIYSVDMRLQGTQFLKEESVKTPLHNPPHSKIPQKRQTTNQSPVNISNTAQNPVYTSSVHMHFQGACSNA